MSMAMTLLQYCRLYIWCRGNKYHLLLPCTLLVVPFWRNAFNWIYSYVYHTLQQGLSMFQLETLRQWWIHKDLQQDEHPYPQRHKPEGHANDWLPLSGRCSHFSKRLTEAWSVQSFLFFHTQLLPVTSLLLLEGLDFRCILPPTNCWKRGCKDIEVWRISIDTPTNNFPTPNSGPMQNSSNWLLV